MLNKIFISIFVICEKYRRAKEAGVDSILKKPLDDDEIAGIL